MRNYEDGIKCLLIVVMLCCVPAFVVTSAQSTGSEMEKKAQGLHSSLGSVARYKTIVLTPIADTWVLEGYNYNYGSSSTLCSLQYVAPDWDGRYKTYGGVSWLKFDVGNIKLANIISAKLKLFCVGGWLSSFFNNHTATWFSNDNWDEHTLVWSTALTLSSALNVQEVTLTNIRKPWTAAGEMTFDVTYFIKYEKNSITTFKILASRGTSSVFASKEYPAVYQGLRPKLEITYKTIPYIGLSFGWLEHWRTDLKSTSYERIYLDELEALGANVWSFTSWEPDQTELTEIKKLILDYANKVNMIIYWYSFEPAKIGTTSWVTYSNEFANELAELARWYRATGITTTTLVLMWMGYEDWWVYDAATKTNNPYKTVLERWLWLDKHIAIMIKTALNRTCGPDNVKIAQYTSLFTDVPESVGEYYGEYPEQPREILTELANYVDYFYIPSWVPDWVDGMRAQLDWLTKNFNKPVIVELGICPQHCQYWYPRLEVNDNNVAVVAKAWLGLYQEFADKILGFVWGGGLYDSYELSRNPPEMSFALIYAEKIRPIYFWLQNETKT